MKWIKIRELVQNYLQRFKASEFSRINLVGIIGLVEVEFRNE